MVNAPATCERLAGRDVRLDLVVGDVGEVHRRGAPPADHLGRSPASISAVPGVQHAGAAAHRRATARRASSASPGLPSTCAVELEHRVAADHQRAPRASSRPATARALSAASSAASSAGSVVGRPATRRRRRPTTSGSTPAARSVASRAGEAEAEDQPGHEIAAPAPACSGSRPSEPRSSAARWNAFRSKSAPWRALRVVAGLQPDPLADLVRRRLARPAEVAVDLEAQMSRPASGSAARMNSQPELGRPASRRGGSRTGCRAGSPAPGACRCRRSPGRPGTPGRRACPACRPGRRGSRARPSAARRTAPSPRRARRPSTAAAASG